MFPFLIGRIKRQIKTLDGVIISVPFPFLIGRIKSYQEQNRKLMESKFPFLIGRIKSL